MTEVNQRFQIWSGVNKDLSVSIVDGNSSAIDLSSGKLRWKMSKEPFGSVILTKSSTVGTSEIEFTDSTAGEATIKLASTDTSTQYGVFYHEAELEDGNGDFSQVFIGHLTIRRSLI